MTLIRYPCSKFYLYKTIMPYVNKFPVYDNTTYVEPFAGSLAVGLKYLDKRYKNYEDHLELMSGVLNLLK